MLMGWSLEVRTQKELTNETLKKHLHLFFLCNFLVIHVTYGLDVECVLLSCLFVNQNSSLQHFL